MKAPTMHNNHTKLQLYKRAMHWNKVSDQNAELYFNGYYDINYTDEDKVKILLDALAVIIDIPTRGWQNPHTHMVRVAEEVIHRIKDVEVKDESN